MDNNNNNSNDFNSLTNKAKDIWDNITKTTDDLVSGSKAKFQKSSLQNELKDAYTRLGNATYDSKKMGINNDEVIQMIMTQIDTLQADIDELTRQIDASDNINRCTSCGAANPLNAKFCAQCGALLPPVTPPTPPQPAPEEGSHEASASATVGDTTVEATVEVTKKSDEE